MQPSFPSPPRTPTPPGCHPLPPPLPGSVEAQIGYQDANTKWLMPARYYALEVHQGEGVRVRIVAINTNPMMSKYAKATNKYHTAEFIASVG